MLSIPLAWLQLTREKPRLLIALAGIAFAVILMFIQLGFQSALYDSTTRFHQSLQGDIILISARTKSLGYLSTFSLRRLYQTLAVEGVASVSPVYVGFRDWKNPENGTLRAIYVYGFRLGDRVFKFPEVEQHLDQLRNNNTVLFDRASRQEYGTIAADFEQGKSVIAEVGTKQITVVGLFTIGPSFGADGNLIVSDLTFLRLFPNRTLGEIEVGLVQLAPDRNVQKTLDTIRAYLPADVKVFSHQEFIEFEKNYWRTSTAIGFIFSLGAAMGMMVGTVIVYQILYSDVSDHWLNMQL